MPGAALSSGGKYIYTISAPMSRKRARGQEIVREYLYYKKKIYASLEALWINRERS